MMGLRYLENTVVVIFPEEVAACNYTCLAVEREEVAVLPPLTCTLVHTRLHESPGKCRSPDATALLSCCFVEGGQPKLKNKDVLRSNFFLYMSK